jgi:hypothetical protein
LGCHEGMGLMFGLGVRRVDFFTGLGFSIWNVLTGKLKWLLFNFCPTVFAASYGCPE